jgi:hypothetical protein
VTGHLLHDDNAIHITRHIIIYIHTYHSRFIRDISDIPARHPHFTKTTNTTDVPGGKPIAVWSQSISDVSAVNFLVAFYDIHGRKGEVLLFCYVPDTTRDMIYNIKCLCLPLRGHMDDTLRMCKKQITICKCRNTRKNFILVTVGTCLAVILNNWIILDRFLLRTIDGLQTYSYPSQSKT